MQFTDNQDELKIKEYINKYIKELQRHFEVSDKKMHALLYEVYSELAPMGFINILISMVKSFYNNKIKRKSSNAN